MRSSLRRAPIRLGLLAGAVVLLGACSGSGGAVASPAASPSQAADAPSATPAEAPAATASDDSSGGGGRGDGDYDYGTAASPAATASAAGDGTHRVNQATGPLGAYLTGDNGLTLYTFKPDSPNASTCTAGCAQAWPPFTVGADDELEDGDGVDGALTTFARDDGSLQVAYNGAPLYYFANDTIAGDTNGQGLGETWFVAKP